MCYDLLRFNPCSGICAGPCLCKESGLPNPPPLLTYHTDTLPTQMVCIFYGAAINIVYAHRRDLTPNGKKAKRTRRKCPNPPTTPQHQACNTATKATRRRTDPAGQAFPGWLWLGLMLGHFRVCRNNHFRVWETTCPPPALRSPLAKTSGSASNIYFRVWESGTITSGSGKTTWCPAMKLLPGYKVALDLLPGLAHVA